MQLSPPKHITFYGAAAVWLLALAAGGMASLAGRPAGILDMTAAFWLAILAGLLLILGNVFNDM
jgi:hypothetical protein